MDTLKELRCDFCGARLSTFTGPPGASPDVWDRLRAEHSDGCTWVAEEDLRRGRNKKHGHKKKKGH